MLQEDIFRDIPPQQERFFGGAGKMLLPCPATVETVLRQIPANKLLTLPLLRRLLAKQFEVQGTCPMTTKTALQTLATDSDEPVAYWRVVKQNGELFPLFPGGIEGHAELLQKEGFTIETEGNVLRVANFKESLACLE